VTHYKDSTTTWTKHLSLAGGRVRIAEFQLLYFREKWLQISPSQGLFWLTVHDFKQWSTTLQQSNGSEQQTSFFDPG